MGFRAEPVAPGTANGAAVNRNSQRCLRFDSLLSSSRSQLSKIGIPIATRTSVWIGCTTPSIPDGMTSLAASLPSIATSRDFSHLAQEACSPAELLDAAHGPFAFL